MNKILNRYSILTFIFSVAMVFVGYQVTHSYFSDQATSTTNTFAAAQAFPTPTSIPVSPGDVVINELMWMGTQGRASDEWIELRNMTSNTIDLSGWKIINAATGPGGTIIIPAGKSIDPHGFFIIANRTNVPDSNSAMTVIPDVADSSMNLQNPGEQLTLQTASSVTIDIANGAGAWLAGHDATGGQNPTPETAMERNSTPGDGTNGANWHDATTQVNMDAGLDEIASPKAANSLP